MFSTSFYSLYSITYTGFFSYMNSNPTAGRLHLLYLDSLRGIAALIVVIHHACLQIDFTGETLNVFQKALLFWFQNGHYSVDFFIVLSGYCLMIPALRAGYALPQGLLLFFKKRARRILPPYYLAAVFSLLLIAFLIGKKTGSLWDASIPVTTAGLVSHLLLVQDVFTTTCYNINHAMWSISVEWRIYFLFPLLLLMWRRLNLLHVILLVALVSGLLVVGLHYLSKVYPLLNESPNGLVPHYLLLFTLGMLGADITLARRGRLGTWRLQRWSLLAGFLTVVILLISALQRYTSFAIWQLTDVIVGLWGVCIIIVCFHVQDSTSKLAQAVKAVVNWRPLVFIGTFGYSLYLVHAPLLQVLWQYLLLPLQLSPFVTFLLLGTLGLTLILLISYIFFLLCEKPFMSKRPANTAIKAAIDPAI